MEVFGILLMVAALVEAIWERVKAVLAPLLNKLDAKGFPTDEAGSVLLAILICLGLGARADVFVLLGIPLGINYLGAILTALIISRGSNLMHDFISGIYQFKIGRKLETEIQCSKADLGV